MTERVNIFGIEIDNVSSETALDELFNFTKSWSKQVSFVNADTLNKAYKNKKLHAALTTSDYVLPDGSGVSLGSRILGQQIQQNVNGTDLFPMLCSRAKKTDVPLYFLGGKKSVAAKARDEMLKKYPGLKIVGVRDGFFEKCDEQEVINDIVQSGAKILLVGFGAPKQECWINDNLSKLKVHTALGVGGLFDFYSGNIPRAPTWMRRSGIEWIFRLYQEPKRMWFRYLVGNPLFIFRVFLQRVQSS